MQDRYAGDVGDYVKLALLRALAPGFNLGVAWYIYPDEDHNADGRHVSYLDRPDEWRHLDPELFDLLAATVRQRRSVSALEASGALPSARFASKPIRTGELPPARRSEAREGWFTDTLDFMAGCDLVFADPDNGLIDDDPHRRRDRKFGKQMPLAEAKAFAHGRQAVIYHHNTRFRGGHDLEVQWWRTQLGEGTVAVRANAYNCRSLFIVNPSRETTGRAKVFCERWRAHRVRWYG